MRPNLMHLRFVCLSAALAGLLGCTPRAEIEIKPIKIEPIHVTMDINLRVDRELDKYLFGEPVPVATSQPANVSP